MYAGRVVETGHRRRVFRRARASVHPRAAGVAAAARPRAKTRSRCRSRASPRRRSRCPSGCAFHPRCRYAIDRAAEVEPSLMQLGETRAACSLSMAGARGSMTSARADPVGPRAGEGVRGARTSWPPRRRARGQRRVLQRLPGETLAIVGESGCGKCTTAPAACYGYRADSGSVRFDGVELMTVDSKALREAAPAHPDGVPGPAGVAEPADDGAATSSPSR